MKLNTLRLHGFKSFADRTQIEFHDGITAIVGPNGCGKSNISDAIRWVLGEQRPTAIRGAKMEEAIFQGTVSRRPVHRGSVAMEISNAAGMLPVPFEEVEIARTVYRDGGSEYQLNRSACRLRDIQELCRDTGLGANAYAVIENRMIDAILSDRAEERRGLFEEAAGIGKYKDRRKAASRRLERAEIDLQRLEDLIGEVESKVRSLARQKGRAERYRELRKRRLDVEVSVARIQLEAFGGRLAEVREFLDGGIEASESLHAGIASAEARVESLRVEQLEAERSRASAAGRVEELRSELVGWERELAVAAERASYADRRLERIGGERDEARARAAQTAAEAKELEGRGKQRNEALARVRSSLEGEGARADEVRERLEEARAAMDAVESREREVARRAAQLQGDADAAASQGQELEVRLEHLATEIQEALDGLAELRSQGDLFGDEIEGFERRVEVAGSNLEEAQSVVEEARKSREVAREAELVAEDRAAALETRLAALDQMERDREGMDPVLKALLANPPPGVVGVLADSISAEPSVVAAIEAYLGVNSRGVVVRDHAAAARVAHWFQDEWKGGGGLVLLPLDRVPPGTPSGSLLDRIEAHGEGSPWVGALLDGVEYQEQSWSAEDGLQPGRDRVAADGTAETRQGLLRVGNPLGATGLLERKEELRSLRRDAVAARKRADQLRNDREAARTRLETAEAALEEARTALRQAEDAHREARSRETERTHRRTRVERAIEELERQREGARTAQARASERAASASEELEKIVGESEALRTRRSAARGALDRVQEEWEGARARVSELSVEEARLEGEVERLTERFEELLRAGATAERRVNELDREESDLHEEMERVKELRERGEGETRRLFELGDEARTRLEERDAQLEGFQEALREAERRVREVRSAEREASEHRHRLELEAQELNGRIGRIQERLEGEWGRSLDSLLEEADPVEAAAEAELRAELTEIVQRMDRLGPVNMLAVEEHEEESARLSFLQEQRDDLVEARNDLRSAIREINQTAIRLFNETFEGIRENFRDTFQRLFEGGECDVWLDDADDPLEATIEIHASPRGKRTQRIDLLSGGERALTALSLLFGIYLVKPSPFCVLDEVDAPLDESNIGRFIRLLQEFKNQTQFIVITHNPRTIEAADWIYGVTMEEPGVSSIVGVRLEEALETAGV